MNPQPHSNQQNSAYDTAIGLAWACINNMANNSSPVQPIDWVSALVCDVSGNLQERLAMPRENATALAWRVVGEIQGALLGDMAIDVDQTTSYTLVLRLNTGERVCVPLAQLMKCAEPSVRSLKQKIEARRNTRH